MCAATVAPLSGSGAFAANTKSNEMDNILRNQFEQLDIPLSDFSKLTNAQLGAMQATMFGGGDGSSAKQGLIDILNSTQ
jgi:hypothetical protein